MDVSNFILKHQCLCGWYHWCHACDVAILYIFHAFCYFWISIMAKENKKGRGKMKKNEKRLLILGIMLVIAFTIWTLLIKTVDVEPLGQNGTDIGFATFNCWFHKLTGVHMTIYNHWLVGTCTNIYLYHIRWNWICSIN